MRSDRSWRLASIYNMSQGRERAEQQLSLVDSALANEQWNYAIMGIFVFGVFVHFAYTEAYTVISKFFTDAL